MGRFCSDAGLGKRGRRPTHRTTFVTRSRPVRRFRHRSLKWRDRAKRPPIPPSSRSRLAWSRRDAAPTIAGLVSLMLAEPGAFLGGDRCATAEPRISPPALMARVGADAA